MSEDIFDMLEDAVKDVEVEVESEPGVFTDNLYVSSQGYLGTYNGSSITIDRNGGIEFTPNTVSFDDVLNSYSISASDIYRIIDRIKEVI